MKPESEMEYKQGQTTLVVGENDCRTVYLPCAENSGAVKSGSNKKLITKVVLGLVTLALIVAATLTAVYLGGRITKDTIKDSWFAFRMPDGTVINEKIIVTGSEEDVTVLGHDTRIVFDYSKGYMVMKTKDEGSHKCYVSTFDRTSVTAPDVDKDQSMKNSNVTKLQEIDYYIQKDRTVDGAILSVRSRDMCQGLPVYWMTRTPKIDSDGGNTRNKRSRRCRTVCRMECSCCPRDCRMHCGVECTWE